jgi:hypothetical protein
MPRKEGRMPRKEGKETRKDVRMEDLKGGMER